MKRTSESPPRRSNVPQRRSQNRPIKQKWLIVGEGQETEPNYFRSLRAEPEVKAKFAITVKGGHGFSQENVMMETVKLKEQAERRGEEFDEVWCVLDVEEPEKQDLLKKALILADNKGISVCLSNPSFDIWFLAHFEKKAAAYNDCAAVMVQLDKYWQKSFKQNYSKSDAKIYDRLKSKRDEAVANAEWVLEKHHQQKTSAKANSSTEVYLLVRKLTEG